MILRGNKSKWLQGRIVVLAPAVPKAALPSALREVRRAPIVLLGTKTTIWSYERA